MRREGMSKGAAEEILELPRRYTKYDLRRAYTDLARKYHPDAAAKHHFDPEVAQQRMIEANQANAALKELFVNDPGRVVERSGSGIKDGYSGVEWREGAEGFRGSSEEFWDFADDWDAEPPAEKPPLSVRSALLGPVFLRVVLLAAFGWLWWRTFPLLPQNLQAYLPSGEWQLADIARLVAGIIYPSYLVLYEIFAGHISGCLRELLNGAVSFLTRHYVDLRSRGASYGCEMYKLLRVQIYALLLAPLVMYLAAMCLAEQTIAIKIALGVAALFLGIDALAACVHGGFVNVWATALSERVEAAYLLLRQRLLKHCGQ